LSSLLAHREIDEESYHVVETRTRRGREKGEKENTLAGARLHDVTRKYDAPKASRRYKEATTSQSSSSPREASLEGPRGEHAALFLSLFLSQSSRFFPTALSLRSSPPPSFTRSRSPLRKSVQDVRERGTTHRASQITPLSKSPDLLASVYTVRNVAIPPFRALRKRLPLSFCVLYSYIPLSRPRRVLRSLDWAATEFFRLRLWLLCSLVRSFVPFIAFPWTRILLCLFFSIGTTRALAAFSSCSLSYPRLRTNESLSFFSRFSYIDYLFELYHHTHLIIY